VKFALLIVTFAIYGGAIAADTLTTAEGFNQGSEVGQKFLNNELPLMPMPAISNENAVDKLPGDYTGTVPTDATGLDAVGLYGGGLGDLMTPALQKNADCMAMVNNPDVMQQVPCDAIKTINESNNGGFVFSRNDPILVKSKMIHSDPAAILSAAGFELEVTEMACAPGTSAVPTETETRVCNEAMVATPGSCQPFQDVQIDRFANFKCKQSASPIEHPNCEKTLNVEVNITESCPANTVISGPFTTAVYYVPEGGTVTVELKCLSPGVFTVSHTASLRYGSWDSIQAANTTKQTYVSSISHADGWDTYQSPYFTSTINCPDGASTCTWSGGFGHTLGVVGSPASWFSPVSATLASQTFQPSIDVVTTTQSWINQCTPYEARVQ